MKKIITGLLTLSLTLCAGLCSVDAKTTNSDILNSEKIESKRNVTVTINPAATVYSVTVDWDSLDFTYDFGEWNPENHEYLNQTKWNNKTSANIVVANHSNTDITVDANFEDNGKKTKTKIDNEIGVTANLTIDKSELASATNHMGQFDDAEKATVNIALVDKAPKQIYKDHYNFGTVTVVFGEKSNN